MKKIVLTLCLLSGFAFSRKSVEFLRDSKLDSSRVLKSLQQELVRSFESLPSQDSLRPYFISYLIWEIESYELEFSYGALVSHRKGKESFLKADVSVGNYKRDNNFFQGNFDYQRPFYAPLPKNLEDKALRHSLWAATDASYKNALQQYHQKIAYLSNKKNSNLYEDNSRREPSSFYFLETRHPLDSTAISRKLKHISETLLKDTHLKEDKISIRSYYTKLYYVDSEGTRYIQGYGEYTLLAALLAQAEDGAPIWDYARITNREKISADALQNFEKEIDGVSSRLDKLQKAPSEEYYRGPVLFQKTAAPSFVASVLLTPQKRLRNFLSDVSDNHFLAGMSGKKYFPKFIDVVDNPAREYFGQKKLHGYYLWDHEGAPALKLNLVKNGKLTSLFQGRRPSLPGPNQKSNGHCRYGELLPSVVELNSEKSLSSEKLKKKLKLIAKEEGAEFALIISKFADEEAYELLNHPLAQYIDLGMVSDSREGTLYFPQVLQADKMDLKTGKTTPLRGLQLSPSDSRLLRSLVYTGKEKHLLEPRAVYSVISPDLLFELVDLKSAQRQYPLKSRL